MSQVWGFTESADFWTSFFFTRDPSQRKMPLIWTCCQNPDQWGLLREQAQIYDPFVGIVHPRGVVTCLGVLSTRGYETPQGCTVELLPRELIPNPIPIATLVTASALPRDALISLAGPGFLQVMDPSHWACFKQVLIETNPQLGPSLSSLESWRQRRGYLDRILEILALRGCTEEEEQEVFTTLRTFTCTAPENHVSCGQLALQTRLRMALKAQLLPPKEWEKLWKDLVNNWYGYVITLNPQEVARLSDLNQTFDL